MILFSICLHATASAGGTVGLLLRLVSATRLENSQCKSYLLIYKLSLTGFMLTSYILSLGCASGGNPNGAGM